MNTLTLMVLAFTTTASYTLVSRARNRDNTAYHAATAVISNLLWFLTLHTLVNTELGWELLLPYVTGTVLGSLSGAFIAMKIEKITGAKT